MGRIISLNITMPDGQTSSRDFDADTVLIGSGPSAVLKIEDAEVSSIHAVIKAGPDGTLTIVDLGSDAGTSVNGAAVWDESIQTHDLPASFYLDGRPAFFGDRAWPAIGPDVEPMHSPTPAEERFEAMPHESYGGEDC